MPMSRDERQEISVRKISNGYLVRHSRETPKGYESTETFHDKMPDLTAFGGRREPAKRRPREV
jgi:hypothetical protein